MQTYCKKNKVKILLLVLGVFIFFCAELSAKNADDLYRDGKFAEAEKEYQKGDMDNPKDIRYRYNRGCAAFQNSDYKTAEAAFSSVLRRAEDKDVLYRAAYNLGNTAFMQNDFSTAADLYRQAIIFNPDGAEAKYNLELALNRLEQQKQNKDNKNGKDNKDQNKQNKEDKGSGDKKNNDKGDRDKDSKDKKNNQQKDNQNGSLPKDEKQLRAEKMQALDRKKAEALLDNIKEDRAKVLQFQMRDKDKDTGSGKNW
ncbi:MAG: tetratricopeptide repeat protein [Spirochaetes bacterium]|nr:tetratricopeptide repeat protein [Spirochaetota bacterium]